MLNVDYPGGTASIDADPDDHIGKHYARGKWYEQDLLDDAWNRVKGPGVAIDVGAHVGGHSVWFAAMGFDVVALEPNPDSYIRLAATVSASNANVQTLRVAAGAQKGNGSVKDPRPGNSGTAGVEVGDGPVEIVTLDSLNLQDVKLVKIDVEGMAGAVLDGAQRLLAEQAPILYIEGDKDEIAAHLPDGYRCLGKFCWTPTYLFAKEDAKRPMRLSAAVMAHPARSEHVGELLASLDRDIPVSWDPNPEPSPDPARRWATGKAAWEMYDPTADWHMVIQDDAIVSTDLLAGLELALTELGPEGIASAYTGTGRPNQAAVKKALTEAGQAGHSWMYTWSLNWGVAIIAPTSTIPGMIEWCDHSDRAHLNYDMRVGQYYRDILGWRTWYTVPSLVDHRDTASLIGHGQGGNRRAHVFHEGSALDIDWTRHDGLPIDVSPRAQRRH